MIYPQSLEASCIDRNNPVEKINSFLWWIDLERVRTWKLKTY